MKLETNRIGITGVPTEVIVSHENNQLSFNIALFDKMSISDTYDIFVEINAYWAKLPEFTQSRIFAIYLEIKNTLDCVFDTNTLTLTLQEQIKRLYEFHELSDVRHWVDFHSNLIIPDTLKDTFKDSHETPGTRERTYLKEDYRWLVSLSIALRVMIPIWGEFIARTRKDSGTTYKEYFAFLLLSHSNIMVSEPMERLRIFVEHSLPADKSKSAAIFGGFCSEDFPTWILGLAIVRRLAVGDVRGIDPSNSLIIFIYKYIIQKVRGHDNNFIGAVKEKTVEGQSQEGENNLSKLEGYKIKQEIPAGDIAIISYYLEDVEKLAKRIRPSIDVDLIHKCVANVKTANIGEILRPQTILTQWVLSSVIQPKGLLYVNRALSYNAMAVAQALLWDKGHYHLAGLISAVEEVGDDELMLGGTDSRARITKDQVEILDKLYPYSRKPAGKQRVIKRVNPGVESVDTLVWMLGEHDWRLTLPPDMVEIITGNPNNRRYGLPYDIKIKAAQLVIELADKTF